MRPDDQRSGQRWRRGRDPDPDGVALAATVAAGVLLGGCAAVAAGTHATPLAVLLALAAAGLAAMPLSEAAERPVLAGAMVLVTLATTGAAVAAMRVAGTSGGLLPRLAATPGRGVAVTGTVVEEPRTVQYGARLVVLRVDRVTTAGRTWRTRERAAVVFGRDAAPSVSTVAVGDQLRLHAGVAPAAHPSRIGVSDQAPVTLRRPHLEAWAPSRSRLLRSSEAFRAAARGSARASLPPEHAGLLVGMALGDTSLLSPTLDRVFKDAGLSHLLAASGENLAVLLAAGLGLAAALGAGRPSLAAVGVLLTIAFALLTRWEPSVLRASVMAALVLAGVATGRGPGGRRALCLAVMFLLLANPSLAATLGFQLSVAAAGFALGAQAAALPAAALALGQLSLAGLPANLLALPLATPPMLLGVVAALAAPVVPPLAVVACRLAAPFLAALLAVAQAAAQLPGATVTLHGPARALPAITVLACAAIVRRWRRRSGPVLAARSR